MIMINISKNILFALISTGNAREIVFNLKWHIKVKLSEVKYE